MSGIWRQSSTQEGRQCAEDQEKCINWHTRIRRLVRRTVYCSKTECMYDVVLGLFIN
jgi:hypothetical protein